MQISDLVHVLKCPDSDEPLVIEDGKLVSAKSRIEHRIVESNFIELTPSKPAPLSDTCSWINATNFYVEQLGKTIDLSIEEKSAWGIYEQFPKGYQNFISIEQQKIEYVTRNTNRKILLDLSGGCGTYTFHFARFFEHIIHFDLYDQSLNYAWHQARKQNIKNILFIRGDYFHLPFLNESISAIISTDAFIYYSPADDLRVLQHARNMLEPTGVMFADFHNRKPFRRNIDIHEYTKQEMHFLQTGLPGSKIHRFCGVPTSLLVGPFKHLLHRMPLTPPVRWTLTVPPAGQHL